MGSETSRFGALDVVRGERSVEDTIISFAPLLDPDLPAAQLASIMADLRSASFHPDRPDGHVVPSYDLVGEGFDERRYWRGPVWINTNWLLWNGLMQHGQTDEADAILLSSLGLVARAWVPRVLRPVRRPGLRDRRVRLDGSPHARLHSSTAGRRASRTDRSPRCALIGGSRRDLDRAGRTRRQAAGDPPRHRRSADEDENDARAEWGPSRPWILSCCRGSSSP